MLLELIELFVYLLCFLEGEKSKMRIKNGHSKLFISFFINISHLRKQPVDKGEGRERLINSGWQVSLLFITIQMAKRINIRQEDLPYRITNLPSAILTECKDKHTLLSVAISIFIKTHHGDSRFMGTSIRAIRKTFGVGQSKAEKIAKILKYEGKFFKYNPYNDSVIAKTFKNKTIATKDKCGRKIWMMYAVKLKIDKTWTLRQIEVYIHDMLYLRAINATERSDKFYSCRKIKNGILLTTKDALTLTKMKNIGGVCKSTAKNICRDLRKIIRLISRKVILNLFLLR